MKEENKVDFWIFFETFFKWRKVILFNIVTVTLITVVISLLLPQKWTATAVILPPTPSTGSLNVEEIGSAYALGSVGLTSLPGIITPSDVIAGVLGSETIMKDIIDQFNIKKRYKLKNLDDAFNKVREMTTILVTQEQLIKISVTTENSQFSANMANAYFEGLDKFSKEALMTTGKQFRIFLEERLNEAEKELNEAAESLKIFQEKHKIFSIERETIKSIEILGSLQGQIIAKKVQLNALQSYSYHGNPQIIKLQKEISALEKQIKELEYGTPHLKGSNKKKDFGIGFSVPLNEVPDIGLKLTRLEMNLEVKKTVYSLLAEQYEKARILESKNTPTITVLDNARPPDLRSFPKRKKLVFLAFMLSIVYSLGLAIVFEGFERARNNRKKYARFFNLIEKSIKEIEPILKRLKIKKNLDTSM